MFDLVARKFQVPCSNEYFVIVDIISVTWTMNAKIFVYNKTSQDPLFCHSVLVNDGT